MNPRVGNISFPVRKPSEPTKKFYSDKLAKLMDAVRCRLVAFLNQPWKEKEQP